MKVMDDMLEKAGVNQEVQELSELSQVRFMDDMLEDKDAIIFVFSCFCSSVSDGKVTGAG